ncbi:MAG TPA: ATP-binding protein [Tepidisphaeraceae bacterium]|nr:ATP-binding protein [Tepidisphaeraceae bacterium]
MLGLRSKLLLGLSGLLLILLIVSLLAATVLDYYSRAIERSYREDYDSVALCQKMKEDAEQLDLAAQRALWSEPVDQSALAAVEADFNRNLASQRQAATLPDEPAETEVLSAAWERYRLQYRRALDPSVSRDERRKFYSLELRPDLQAVRLASQRLIEMNLSSILSVPGRAQATTRRAHWAMRTLTISAVMLSILLALMIGRIILKPIRALTESVHEVERGNFDQAVPIHAHDELGALAKAFNTMAQRLRAYRRLDHERLVRTERTTQLAIDSLPDAVLVINPDGRIELSNSAARKLLRIMPGDEVDSSSRQWLSALWRQISSAGDRTELRDYESTVQIELDGEARFFLPRTVLILDDSSQVVGATVVLADVTGLRRLDEMKNNLLSLVSHELKTPLTSARMVLHLVASGKIGPLTAKQTELLSAARDDTDRLHQIVENLLDMSRIESGRALMDLHPIEPRELVNRSLEPLLGMFQGQQVSLATEVDAGLGPVLADATRIGHVFANLLMNSLRHTRPGGRVHVGARGRGNAVEFWVRDTGSGIPRQHLHQVFDKFFRVPGQSSTGGSGLGLALVKHVVEAHGGQVRVSSAEGEGSLFAFTLRAISADPAATATSAQEISPPRTYAPT